MTHGQGAHGVRTCLEHSILPFVQSLLRRRINARTRGSSGNSTSREKKMPSWTRSARRQSDASNDRMSQLSTRPDSKLAWSLWFPRRFPHCYPRPLLAVDGCEWTILRGGLRDSRGTSVCLLTWCASWRRLFSLALHRRGPGRREGWGRDLNAGTGALPSFGGGAVRPSPRAFACSCGEPRSARQV